MMWLRHLFAIGVLPFTVTVLIPLWLARRDHIELVLAAGPARLISQLVGFLLVVIGLVLFVASFRRALPVGSPVSRHERPADPAFRGTSVAASVR
jgi:hypothetical protein